MATLLLIAKACPRPASRPKIIHWTCLLLLRLAWAMSIWDSGTAANDGLRWWSSGLSLGISYILMQLLAFILNSSPLCYFFFGFLVLSGMYTSLRSWLQEHITKYLCFSQPKSFLAILVPWTVIVKRSVEAYDMVLAWISFRRLDNDARSTIARVGLKRGCHKVLWETSKSPWDFLLGTGASYFWFRDYLYSYRTIPRCLLALMLNGQSEAMLLRLIGIYSGPEARF